MAPGTILDWLNRLGIVFNFLAGFMLAPELLGIQRIHRLEKRLEDAFTEANKTLTSALKRIQDIWAEHKDFVVGSLATILFMASTVVFYDWYSSNRDLPADSWRYYYERYPEIVGWLVGDTLEEYREFYRESSRIILLICIPGWLIFFSLLIALGAWSSEDYNKLPLLHRASKAIGWGLLIFLIITTAPVWVPFVAFCGLLVYLWLLCMRLLILLSSQAIILLEGDQRLRDLIISLGIFLFIIGNLFQLIATF